MTTCEGSHLYKNTFQLIKYIPQSVVLTILNTITLCGFYCLIHYDEKN